MFERNLNTYPGYDRETHAKYRKFLEAMIAVVDEKEVKVNGFIPAPDVFSKIYYSESGDTNIISLDHATIMYVAMLTRFSRRKYRETDYKKVISRVLEFFIKEQDWRSLSDINRVFLFFGIIHFIHFNQDICKIVKFYEKLYNKYVTRNKDIKSFYNSKFNKDPIAKIEHMLKSFKQHNVIDMRIYRLLSMVSSGLKRSADGMLFVGEACDSLWRVELDNFIDHCIVNDGFDLRNISYIVSREDINIQSLMKDIPFITRV